MDPELNPKANNFVWFSNSLEMTDLSTTLRDLSKNLGKSLKDIIQSPFTDQDLKIVNQYKKEKSDGRFYKNQKTPTPDQFLQMCKDFLDENKDKDLAAIDIDHLALVKAFSNQKQAIDDVIVGCNELKLTYSNSLFIFLSQFNRGILSRIKEKSNEMAAQRSDVYQTDTIFQIADDVYALQNPFQLKVEFYRKVNPKAYDYLRSHFGPKSPGGKVSFPTVGKLFIEILKDRFSDFYYKDLYIRDIEIPNRFKDDNLEDILPEFD